MVILSPIKSTSPNQRLFQNTLKSDPTYLKCTVEIFWDSLVSKIRCPDKGYCVRILEWGILKCLKTAQSLIAHSVERQQSAAAKSPLETRKGIRRRAQLWPAAQRAAATNATSAFSWIIGGVVKRRSGGRTKCQKITTENGRRRTDGRKTANLETNCS